MQKSVSNVGGVPIERLLGRENYATWKVAVNAFLDLDDLWDNVVELNDGIPAEPDKDRKARNKLKLSIDPSCYTHIQNASTAAEIWKALADAFEDSGLTRRCGLLRKLIMTTYKMCGSMEKYVSEVVNTAHQLNNTGLRVDEEWVGMILLCGLPESYRPMIMALENSGMKITGDAIKTKLLQEVSFEEQNQAFASTFGTPHRRPIVCHTCGEEGHYARECDGSYHEYADVPTSCNRRRDANCLLSVLSVIEGSNNSEWFFDSAASVHMTSNRQMLIDPESCEGKVMTANGRSLDMKSKGTVTVQVNPSCETSEVDLLDVRYVPGLTANLISVSEMVKKGLKVVFDNRGCRVIRGNVRIEGRLVANGEFKDNLFTLKQRRPHCAMMINATAKNGKKKQKYEKRSRASPPEEDQVEVKEEPKKSRHRNRKRKSHVRCQEYEINVMKNAPPSSINMQGTPESKHKPSGGGCSTMGEYSELRPLKDENTRKDYPQADLNDPETPNGSLVSKGHQQRWGMDTVASVVRENSLNFLLTVAAQRVMQMDQIIGCVLKKFGMSSGNTINQEAAMLTRLLGSTEFQFFQEDLTS